MGASNTSYPTALGKASLLISKTTPTSTINATINNGEIIFKTVSALLVLVNVLGNSLVIIVLKSRSMKTPMHYSLLNLAVADLIVGIFVIPRIILKDIYPHPQGQSGDIVCKLISRGNFAWFSTYSSVFTLLFIAFERYYAIMKPLQFRQIIKTKTFMIFAPICWIMAGIFIIPSFYLPVTFTDVQRYACRSDWPKLFKKWYYSIRFLVEGIFPISIMAVLYGRIIHRLWFNVGENNIPMQCVRRKRKKVTKTMLILSAIYVICWFPDNLMHELEVWFLISYPDHLHDTFNFLIVFNSTVNPVVYALQFKEFRKGVKKLFSPCARRRMRKHVIQHRKEPEAAIIGHVNLVAIRTFQTRPIKVDFKSLRTAEFAQLSQPVG